MHLVFEAPPGWLFGYSGFDEAALTVAARKVGRYF